MTGTNAQRVGRLLVHLIKQPRYVVPYIQTNFVQPREALDLDLPWMSYAAIDFLEQFVRPGMSVFEYGSGGSTLFFARRALGVISVEDNRSWFEKVDRRLQERGFKNAELRYRPFHFANPTNFERSDYLNSIPNRKFDVIVVDGTEENVVVRPQCFHHAENFVATGGIIVLDDSWRYPGLSQTHHAKEMKVFESVGPARMGVTSTNIFFY